MIGLKAIWINGKEIFKAMMKTSIMTGFATSMSNARIT